MTTVPTIEPSRVTAGDTLTFRRSLAGYSAADWTLSYHLVNAEGRIGFDATADGSDFLVTVAASVTAEWTAGTYKWRAYVTAGTDRHEVGRGSIRIEADFATVLSMETRSHAEVVLANIQAVIERRASIDQSSYKIEGRELARTPLPELLALRDKYQRMVNAERQAERVRRGTGTRPRILTRFS